MSSADDILATIMEYGLEEAVRRFYSLYKGVVTDNKDPDGLGKIQVKVTDLGQETALDVWVSPIFHMAGANKGFFFPPDVGDSVHLAYFNGDASDPLGYLGGWFGKGELPSEFAPKDKHPYVRGIMTRLGHSLAFSDEPGSESVRLVWHKPKDGDPALTNTAKTAERGAEGKYSMLEFNKDGGFSILVNSGECTMTWLPDKSQFLITAKQGNASHSITMDPDGIKIIDKDGNALNLDGGKLTAIVNGSINFTGKTANISTGGVSLGFPAPISAVNGEALLLWLATHTHAGVTTGPGVSGPPVVPPTPALLSKSVKLKP